MEPNGAEGSWGNANKENGMWREEVLSCQPNGENWKTQKDVVHEVA